MKSRLIVLAGLVFFAVLSLTAVPDSTGRTITERWFNDSPDYHLVWEQYLHQLRVAESDFHSMISGEAISRDRLAKVHLRIKMLSTKIKSVTPEQSGLQAEAHGRFNEEHLKIENSLLALIKGHEDMEEWNRLVESLRKDSSDLIVASDRLAVTATGAGAGSELVYIMSRQLMLLQRIIGNLHWLSHSPGTEQDIISVDRIGRDAALFAKVVNALLKGDSRLGIKAVKDNTLQAGLYDLMDATRDTLTDKMVQLLNLSPSIFEYKESVRGLSLSIEILERAEKPV